MSCYHQLKQLWSEGIHWTASGCSILLACFLSISTVYAQDVTINVVTPDPTNASNFVPVDGFRWLVEEDTTWNIEPGVPKGVTLSTGFHRSYSPVTQNGESAVGNPDPVQTTGLDPAKRYFISVTPHDGYTIGGAEIEAGATSVQVVVNPQPIPTAQISVFVFEDFSPINGAPDLPEEDPITSFNAARLTDPDGGRFDPTQFGIILEEAGGRYGHTGGAVTLDAFGNPLGTEYQYDASGDAVLDADGNPIVVTLGGNTVNIFPAADGSLLIKNLAPGKYGIKVVPPAGQDWAQTSTIEGTKTIDAWVAANEPPYFTEFGPPGFHAFIGFQKTFEDTAFKTDPANPGSATIMGQIVNNHMTRPPEVGFFNGGPFPGCWVGLNRFAGLPAIEVQPCDEDSNFAFHNVPPGDYSLAIWDINLDIIIAQQTVIVPVTPGAVVDLAQVPVFNWNARIIPSVFYDTDEDGFWDAGETNLAPDASAINLRFRNGTVYKSFGIDGAGIAPFEEVFPFFHWLVAEVDFATLKATGVTYVVDSGGEVRPDAGWADPTFDELNPQPQGVTNSNTGNDLSTTIPGEVLTLGIQTFLGQTNYLHFGKKLYAPGENGGISGLVLYAITRAENDPRLGAAEEWEPGIPRVQVNLYRDALDDGIIDSAAGGDVAVISGVSQHQRPDVDSHPLGNFPGVEDTDHNSNGSFDYGDAIQVTWTDSWDDSNPTGCIPDSEPFIAHEGTATAFTPDCYDGLRNFNQIREGVFDGGYLFNSYMDNGVEVAPLPIGMYIVESVLPEGGYKNMKEEDRNVDFGDSYIPAPAPLLLPPVCIGDDHLVPAYMSYQTDGNGDPLVAGSTPDPAPFAGDTRQLCDRKSISLTNGKNAAVDFFMFTDVPVAAHVVGMIMDDLANEFDPNSANFGEKYAPPWLPVTFRDWTGREILRTYADEWGKYNALLPSSYSVHIPMPTGLSPNMLTACMNDASPILNPVTGELEKDPFHNPQYSQFCYTFQYLAGSTTYLDTPVVPVSAFAGPDQFPLDCALPTNTPGIFSVSSNNAQGPGPVAVADDTVTITSLGMVEVANPEYDGTSGTTKTIMRDYGFGAAAGTVSINGIDVATATWLDSEITLTVPGGTTTGQLVVTSAASVESINAVTLNMLAPDEVVAHVFPTNTLTGTPIQDAIDAAAPGDLIVVEPGNYFEMVIMHKPVRLQGYGAATATINAVRAPGSKLSDWRQKVTDLLSLTQFDLLPGQQLGELIAGQPEFGNEEGPAILVVGNVGEYASADSRIDALGITGAIQGGGILVGGYIDNLEISNNDIFTNSGNFGGGIRVGFPMLTNNSGHVDAENNNLNIHNNLINQNGGMGGAGGGVALYTGADNYQITYNMICGNFTQGNGAGIGHLGLSDNGFIMNNTIAYNQLFNQGLEKHGGGLFIGGKEGLGGLATPGSGSVLVEANRIMGNLAGSGSGGGASLATVNGQDVADNPLLSSLWHSIKLYDNIIVNNVAGRAGGGVSLFDTAAVSMVHNTITNNDSTATVAATIPSAPPGTGLRESTPQPGAGIASHTHSTALATTSGQSHSDPELVNNIVLHNRSFYWLIDTTTFPEEFRLVPDLSPAEPVVYSDIAVVDNLALLLNPQYSVLSDISENLSYAPTNQLEADSANVFVAPLANGQPGQTVIIQETTTNINVSAALDEGGNFIDVRFGPLTLDPALIGNYRLDTAGVNPAVDSGDMAALNVNLSLIADDFYGTARYWNTGPEIGAEEIVNGVQTELPFTFDDRVRISSAGPLVDLQAFSTNIRRLLKNDIGAGLRIDAEAVPGSETRNGILTWNSPLGRQFTFTTPSTGSSSVGKFRFQYKAHPNSNAATVLLIKDISVIRAFATGLPNGALRWRVNGWSKFPTGTRVRLYPNSTATGTPIADWNLDQNGKWAYSNDNGPDYTGITHVSVRIGNRVLKNIPLEIR